MISAIIVAGGKGIRMRHTTRKQYLALGGLPILGHTLFPFDACDEINIIFLVVPKQDIDFCHKNILSPLKLKKKVSVVPGGTERQNSVYNGLLAVHEFRFQNGEQKRDNDIVVIHDGVRPFVRPEQISACIQTAGELGASILGIPAQDTLKRISHSNQIEQTLDRSNIWLAQTPQAFQYELILRAHEAARNEGYLGTDDASLVERLGKPVKIIPGSRLNIKITTPEDLELAQAIAEICV